MGDDSRNDPMIRDKKKLPMSGSSVVPKFLFSLCVIFPLWLVICLPMMIVSQLIIKVMGFFEGKSKSAKTDEFGTCSAALGTASSGRELDLVLFGSTGFTGKMAAVYLAKKYGTAFRWAIAGRRLGALQTLKDELCTYNPALKDHLVLIVADSSDTGSIDAMVKQAKVMITTAGPFDKYGTTLVRSCAQYGTHYCDITGETDWVRKMIDQFDDVAKESGARIVNFCGHDCVPWDLVTLECSELLKEKYGESLESISFYDEISSAPSGGTIATAMHALGNRVKYKARLGFDPLLKSLSGKASTNKLSPKVQGSLGYSSEYRSWVGPFVMAMVMANCVRRSNCVNNYGSKVVYKEAQVYPSFMAGFVTVMGMILLGTILFCPPLRWLFTGTALLPAPGGGPSEASMDRGFLKITAFANGTGGAKVKGMMYFPTDPGYRDTARMLVESGLVLALNGDDKRIRSGGGVLTPATCQGKVLTERLITSGSSITVE